jgi:hypothetical protein
MPVFFLRPEDGHRRYFVIDTDPSPAAKTGTVIAELMDEGHARQVAAALNGQPNVPDPDPFAAPA